MSNKLTLYHNTTNENALKINKEGIIPGKKMFAYGKGNEAEGDGVWCRNYRTYGNGGATITFEISEDDEALYKANDTEYIVYREVKPEEIKDIDLMISDIPSNPKRDDNINSTVESDIPVAIQNWGKEKVIKVLSNNKAHFIEPYNIEQLEYLINTGKKYCKGSIKMTENKQLNEGIHLYGFVKDEDGNRTIIEDKDYPDKQSFEKDLRANGYIVNRVNDNKDMYIMDHSDYPSISIIKSEIAKLKKDYNYYKENGWETLYNSTKSKIDSLQKLIDEANKISLTENYKLEEYDFDDYNKRIEEYKNKQLQDFISKLRTNLPKCKVSEPIHSKYSGDRIKITHKNLIITIILMELLETDSGKPEYAISYDGHQQYIGVADDVIQFIKDYIEQDYRLTENYKLEEVSRNEMLAKTKREKNSRIQRSNAYRGFRLEDVNTDSLLVHDTLPITCRVGAYWDTVELLDFLYWVQYESEKNKDNQVNVESITRAIMDAIDAKDIKVDCTCRRFCL